MHELIALYSIQYNVLALFGKSIFLCCSSCYAVSSSNLAGSHGIFPYFVIAGARSGGAEGCWLQFWPRVFRAAFGSSLRGTERGIARAAVISTRTQLVSLLFYSIFEEKEPVNCYYLCLICMRTVVLRLSWEETLFIL